MSKLKQKNLISQRNQALKQKNLKRQKQNQRKRKTKINLKFKTMKYQVRLIHPLEILMMKVKKILNYCTSRQISRKTMCQESIFF